MHMTFIRNALSIAALSTGLLATPAMAADEQPHSDGVVSTISDATITTKVKARMLNDKDLKSTDIHVSTFNGVVELSGTVPSESAKAQAAADARSVESVKSVDAAAIVVKPR
ncbi:MAG TPA: BON domain-containing protein [Rhodocyclaceae bacterium]|nr:BON domain-containing protein [Rhodocyclaceae bacterium]